MASTFKDYSSIVGENIRERRRQLGKSQTDLALDTGSDKTAISRIENGKQEITLTQLGWFAKALETEPWVLMQEKETLSNSGKLQQYITSNETKINSLSPELVEKARRHLAIALELE